MKSGCCGTSRCSAHHGSRSVWHRLRRHWVRRRLVSPPLGRAVSDITQLGGRFVIAPYSRDQEREADGVGVELAARAGWNPTGLSDFLVILEREVERQSGTPRRSSFFETHPATPERVLKTAKQAKKVARGMAGPIAGNRSEFLAKLDGLVIGDDPAVGLFRDSRSPTLR